jgi:hypothetical protein
MRVRFLQGLSSIDEGLTPSEKSTVDNWVDDIGQHPLHPDDKHHHIGHMHTDHVFTDKDPHRTVVPVGDTSDSFALPHIEKHLKKHGYEVKDYHKGLASKGNRDIKIGKLLQKGGAADEDLHRMFSSDPSREGGKSSKHDNHVVISRHPHDVAGMSACDHPWDSCLNFKDGSERGHLPHEVKQGTMVAYLAHKDDKAAEKPMGRVAIRPYTSDEGHRIYRAEAKHSTYGNTAGGGLQKAAHDWSMKHFPAKDGQFYRRQPHTYVEHPGPAREHTMGKMDPSKMSQDSMSRYIFRMKGSKMPEHHFDSIMKHGSDDTKEDLVNAHAGKHHLGAVAEHLPDQLINTPVFSQKTPHIYKNPDTGKSGIISGHNVLHKATADHAEAAIPGLGGHIKKAASSPSHHAHRGLIYVAKSNPKGIVAAHKDTLHSSVISSPIGTSAEGSLWNLESIASHTGKGPFDQMMSKIKSGVDTYKPSHPKSNWVHHAMDAFRSDTSSPYGSSIHRPASHLLRGIRENPNYDSSKHEGALKKMKGK